MPTPNASLISKEEVEWEIIKAPNTRKGSLELLEFVRICFWCNQPLAGYAVLQEIARREIKG